MATISKTDGVSVLALQSISTGSVVLSSALDVSSKLAITLFMHFGRRATTALTNPFRFRVEASSKASGDGHWYPLAEFLTAIATAESEAVSGTVSAGQAVITVASTTNLTVPELIYLDNSTIANSEWGVIKSLVTNTSVTIEDNLVNAQTGSTIYDQAERFVFQADVAAITRLRLVAENHSGQTVAVEAHAVTGDSIG